MGGSGPAEGARDFIIERERERAQETEPDRPRKQVSAGLVGRGVAAGPTGAGGNIIIEKKLNL